MATGLSLEGYYNKILTATDGEAVRDAIINAAKEISTKAESSNYLGGHYYTDFATSSKYYEYYDSLFGTKDEDPEKRKLGLVDYLDLEDELIPDIDKFRTSEALMRSEDIYKLVNNYMRPSLAEILHYQTDPHADKDQKKAIDSYIKDIVEAKDAISTALTNKGLNPETTQIPVSPSHPEITEPVKSFRDYARLIALVGTAFNTELEDLSITENHKSFYANNDKPPSAVPKAYAYQKVSLNISNSLKEKTFSSAEDNNKTHDISEENTQDKTWDGYSLVKVSISDGTSSVSGKKTSADGVIIDDDDFLSSKVITDKDRHSASEDRVRGWKSVEVKIEPEQLPEGTTFKVTFMYEDRELITVECPAYGNAKCPVDVPMTKDMGGGHIRYFSGWSPSPLMVTSDMTCVATYAPGAPSSDEEITDPWDIIVSKGGAGYNLGQWKPLRLGGSINATVYMQKIAEGEDGSTSTWIAKNVITNPYSGYRNWWDSNVRKYLNNTVFAAMQNGLDGAPIVADSIVPVTKCSLGCNTATKGVIEMETVDRIWIPSARELFGEHPKAQVNTLLENAYRGINPNNPYNPEDTIFEGNSAGEAGGDSAARPYRRAPATYYNVSLNYSYHFASYSINSFWFAYIGEERYSYPYTQYTGGASWIYHYAPGNTDKRRKGNGDDAKIDLRPVPTNSSKIIRNNTANTAGSNYLLRSIAETRESKNDNEGATTWVYKSPGRTYPAFISTSGGYNVTTDTNYNNAFPLVIGFCL